MARVLVIDDSGYFRSSSRLALCRDGHIVSFAGDGECGEELLASGAYEVVVIGVSLPVADGADVLRSIRKKVIDTPAIALGVGVSDSTRSKLSSLGVVDVIERFVEPSVIVDAVNRAARQSVAWAA